MKNTLVIIVSGVIIFLAGCRQKDESLQNTRDTVAIPAAAAGMERKLVFQDCNAVVVGEGVRLRATPSTSAEVLEKLNTGVLLKTIRAGDRKVLLGKQGSCNPDGFYWYEVMESGGKRGWIYGEFMYNLIVKGRDDEKLDSREQKLFGRSFSLNGQQYRFGFASSGNRTAQYEDGEPRCVNYLFPFMYLENDGSVLPLKYLPNKKNSLPMFDLTREKGYFQFSRGGALDDKVNAFRGMETELQLTVARMTGEGEEPYRYTLILRPAEGYFSATPANPGEEYLP